MKSKYVFNFLCFVLFFCLFVVKGEGLIENRKFIIVAENYPPYEYEEDGVAKGVNVELISTIMKRLNVEFEIKFYPWSRAWMLLEKGKVDAASTISYTEDREPFIYYSDAQRNPKDSVDSAGEHQWITDYVFFVNNRYKDSLIFTSYKQLKSAGYKIGIIKDYSYNPGFLNAGLNTVTLFNPQEGFDKLLSGEIDLFPFDRVIGKNLLGKNTLIKNITYLPKIIFSKPCQMGFAKHSNYPEIDKLRNRFQLELAKMKISGEYDALFNKYLGKLSDRKLLFVCEEWRPFEYLEDGKPTGIDVDIADAIMRKLGIPYEIKFYPWARAWLTIQKGKADAVLSISYKYTRENNLYYTRGQVEAAKTGGVARDYLWISEYVFFVKSKKRGLLKFDSFEQILKDGYKVGTNKDYSYCKEFLESGIKSAFVANNTEEGFLALVAGEIDLYPMDKTIGLATLNKMGISESVVYLEKPLFSKPYLAPFVKNSDFPNLELIMYRFYDELFEMRKDGRYDEIYQKYIKGSNL